MGRTKRFYADTPGWKLNTDEPEVAGFWFGSGYLVAHLNPAAASIPCPDRMNVAVKVNDLEAEHARLSRIGVQVGKLEVKPWGERSFTFTDPDDYSWVHAQAN